MALITDPDDLEWLIDEQAMAFLKDGAITVDTDKELFDMAIKKKPLTAQQLIDLFDIEFEYGLVHELSKAGFEANFNLSGTKVDFLLGGKDVVTNVPMKAGVVKLLQEGMMPEAGKAALNKKIKAALNVVLKQVPDEETQVEWLETLDTDPETGPPMAETTPNEMTFQTIVDEDDLEEEDSAPAPVTHTLSEVLSMNKTKLENAEIMYQPVGSTSSESMYHMIGKAGQLKFAARWNHGNLSIRVEGPVKKHQNKLISAGFNESYIEKGYTSVHFTGVTDLMASRTLGAVLFGLGMQFDTAMPNLETIKGQGV